MSGSAGILDGERLETVNNLCLGKGAKGEQNQKRGRVFQKILQEFLFPSFHNLRKRKRKDLSIVHG